MAPILLSEGRGVNMYEPTGREWVLIKESLALHGMAMAQYAMGTKKDGQPFYLNSDIQEVNEITALLRKMGTTPKLAIVRSNEQIESTTGPGDGPEYPHTPDAA